MWVNRYILNQINNVISKESIGLIRDDELLIFKNISVVEVEKNKEDLIRTFKTNRLSTIRFKQIKRADFFNVHFDLMQDFYQPYKERARWFLIH